MERASGQLPIAVSALVNQAEQLAASAERIRALWNAVDYHIDLTQAQAAHWFALTLEYAPDLIIELGRNRGNSTAVFTEAANLTGATRVKSYCLSRGWERRGAVAKAVKDEAWFHPLEIITADIRGVDFRAAVGSARRVMVLWDAHGFEVAEAVLCNLMPVLAEREHLVVCHDVSDARLPGTASKYSGRPIWRGYHDYYHSAAVEPRAHVSLFWVMSVMDQAIAMLDFCCKNGIELHSPDYEWHLADRSRPEVTASARSAVPVGLFSEKNDWVYFTLNESRGPYDFPALATVYETFGPSSGSLLQRRVEELQAELQAMRGSTSWRVTAALRGLGRLMRRR